MLILADDLMDYGCKEFGKESPDGLYLLVLPLDAVSMENIKVNISCTGDASQSMKKIVFEFATTKRVKLCAETTNATTVATQENQKEIVEEEEMHEVVRQL
jgi:hypothetical protein